MSTGKLAVAVSWLSLGNVMTRALSLLSMPLLTRWLSPDAYGTAALVGTLVSLSCVFAIAGIDMGYARHAFSGQAGPAAAVEAFCWRWVIACAAAFALGAGALWWLAASRLGLPPGLAGFVVVGVLSSALMTMATTRARLQDRYARLTWVQFGSACVATAASLCMAAWWRQDAWPLLVAMVVGYALPTVLLGAPPIMRLREPAGLSAAQRRSVATTGLAGILTAPAYWALTSSDRWFLAVYQGSTAVGIYSIGFTVGTIGMVVSSAITAAWLPELSRDESISGSGLAHRKRDMAMVLIAIMLIVAVGVSAAGGDVIRALADPRFHAAAVVVPWLAAGVFFYGVMHVGNALLVMRGKLHWSALAWTVALLVSLLLNRSLIPANGALAAAFAQALSFLVVMVLVWLAVLRFEPLRLGGARLSAGLLLAVASVVAMQGSWHVNPWLSLILKLPVWAAFAASCLAIMAPQAVALVRQKLQGVA